MSEYGITETGFRIKRFDTILAEINADQSEGFGVQVGANTRSFLNVMNTSVACPPSKYLFVMYAP